MTRVLVSSSSLATRLAACPRVYYVYTHRRRHTHTHTGRTPTPTRYTTRPDLGFACNRPFNADAALYRPRRLSQGARGRASGRRRRAMCYTMCASVSRSRAD